MGEAKGWEKPRVARRLSERRSTSVRLYVSEKRFVTSGHRRLSLRSLAVFVCPTPPAFRRPPSPPALSLQAAFQPRSPWRRPASLQAAFQPRSPWWRATLCRAPAPPPSWRKAQAAFQPHSPWRRPASLQAAFQPRSPWWRATLCRAPAPPPSWRKAQAAVRPAARRSLIPQSEPVLLPVRLWRSPPHIVLWRCQPRIAPRRRAKAGPNGRRAVLPAPTDDTRSL